MMNSVKIISLGGFGNVTNNMFVYETNEDILLVDCGVGFPTGEMLGVDLTIPDISYLEDKKDKIRGMILSHGHDDHIGALPYILPKLPSISIFGSRWALALAQSKTREFGISGRFEEVKEEDTLKLGKLKIEFIEAPHSIPETLHLAITTPIGIFYHAPDFKLDLRPVLGEPTDRNLIHRVSQRGVLCLLSDCLRAERPGFTPSESKIEEVFEREIENCRGIFAITTMSSNISRLKQAIDVALAHNRKIVSVGRSIEKNIELALKMGYLKYPKKIFVQSRFIERFPPQALALLVAGSQAQAGSALERIVSGEHKIKLGKGDKVVFSSDYIPGNEVAVYNLIDDLLRLGVEVSYSEITAGVHVSGHGQAEDLRKLMEMTKPKYLMPIGGNLRHMVAYRRLAVSMGYGENDVLIPDNGQIIEFFENGQIDMSHTVATKTIMVDALGVGDIGNVVLRDRQVLASEGILVAIVQIEQNTFKLVSDPDILTRGFIYVKESESLLAQARREIKKVVLRQKVRDIRILKRTIQESLEKFFFNKTGRQPMILSFIIEV